MSPLRAVLFAHWQSSFNRVRRQQGSMGAVATVIIMALLVMTLILPLTVSLAVVGYLCGSALQDPSAYGNQAQAVARAVGGAALFLTAITVMGGPVAGLSGSTRQLPWEQLQAFPAPPRLLFAAELVAGAGELITSLELVVLAAFLLGVTVGWPFLAPFALFAFVGTAISMLSLQMITGSLTHRLSRQTVAVLAVLPFIAIGMSMATPSIVKTVTDAQNRLVLDEVLRAAASTPGGQVFAASALAHTGQWLDALLRLLPLGLLAIVSVFAAYLLVAREKEATITETGAAKKLWSFSTPRWGLARLQLHTLAGSLPGKISLLMPLITIVVIRGPMAAIRGTGWVVPSAFIYASVSSINVLYNQFGLDRHGVKSLFLLPIDEKELLIGKQIGFSLWQGLQMVMLTALLALTGHSDPPELAGGVLVACSLHLIFSIIGQFMSIWQPRPLNRGGMRANQPPLMVVLATMGSLIVTAAFLGGTWYALAHFVPGKEWVGFAALTALLFFVFQLALRFNTAFLRSNKEAIVETLSASA